VTSVIDLGSSHMRHLVDEETGRTLCKRPAARMFILDPKKETAYPLCPGCLGGSPKKGRIRVAPKEERALDGIVFDSRSEMNRYAELKMLERAGHIQDLQLQPRFLLQAATATERKMEYVADFSYVEAGATIVEDVKGLRTEVYKLKRKIFLAKYPEVNFREVGV
jgi:Protein of unknown function (DUF1064)